MNTSECGQDIIDRICTGDDTGADSLYEVLHRGLRWFLQRRTGESNVEYEVHEVLAQLVSAIRDGQVHEGNRLPALARTMALNVAAGLKQREPRKPVIAEVEIVRESLARMDARKRELLSRYYVQGQTAEEIYSETGVSATDLRSLRMCAKSDFERARHAGAQTATGT